MWWVKAHVASFEVEYFLDARSGVEHEGEQNVISPSGWCGLVNPAQGALFGDESRKPSVEAKPQADYRHFTDRWMAAKRRIDRTYSMSTKDAAAMAMVWDGVGKDLEMATAVITQYFLNDEPFFEGHSATKLLNQLDKFKARAIKAANGSGSNGHAKNGRIQENLKLDLPRRRLQDMKTEILGEM